MIDNEKMIEATQHYVMETLEKAEAGHDWWHVLRVFNISVEMAQKMNADMTVVSLASLLHDVGDSKFHDGDETIGPRMIREFLNTLPLDKNIFEEVMYIVENMSFKRSFDFKGEKSLAFQIVQDADRLDAIG
ncbi:MAG: HD domain-containing protein, partial [Bacteroidales bacterium]|nr:HD domain-containing protein [Bacteroidales bacterium]